MIEGRPCNFVMAKVLVEEDCDPMEGEFDIRVVHSLDGIPVSGGEINLLDEVAEAFSEHLSASQLVIAPGPTLVLFKEACEFNGAGFDYWYEVEHVCAECQTTGSVSLEI